MARTADLSTATGTTLKRRCLQALLCLSLAGGVQAHEPPAGVSPALGSLNFPTSTQSAPAQAAFVEGMLFLHLFEYPSAAQSFQRAQQLDPDFAMAYWGEAMSHTHPVWNQQDVTAARAALAKLGATPEARAAKAGSDREKAYLQVTEILYGEGEKRERDRLVALAWEDIVKRFPDDDEAKLFHSLALLGINQGVRDLPNFLHAAAIAKDVYARQPQHPGAAHYWIHGMDDPVNAAGALVAARALSKIAPGAGHSQHMTSHIFMALGLWDDVVDSNVAARDVVNQLRRDKGQPPYSCGHYTEWLQYAYFQQGREQEAYQLLLNCQREGRAVLDWMRVNPAPGAPPAQALASAKARLDTTLVTLRATAIVESPRFRPQAMAMDLDVSDIGRHSGWAVFSRGLDQAWRGDLKRANQSLLALRTVAAEPEEVEDNGSTRAYLGIMVQMLEGLIAQQAGNTDAGLALAAAAAKTYDATPFDFGPPATVKPPHELLGDMLLAAGKKKEALIAFDRALELAPKRALSLAGRESALAR